MVLKSALLLSLAVAIFLLASPSRAFELRLGLEHGEVASRNFSQGFYPNNVRDRVELVVRDGYHVTFHFAHFNVEEGGGDEHFPCGDYVTIIDGITNETLAQLCGDASQSRPLAPDLMDQKFVASGNRMIFEMRSDGSNGGVEGQSKPTGFIGYYVMEDIDECRQQAELVFDTLEEDTTCQHTCINYPGGYRCVCDAGFTLSSDGRSCNVLPSGCNTFDATETSGVITPPMYMGQYARNVSCIWKLKANPGENLELTFGDTFDIEANNGQCFYDYIEIVDHNGSKGKFCGQTAPGKALRSTSDWMTVVFHSDGFVEGAGFQIHYQSQGVRCRIPTLPAYSRLATPVAASLDGFRYLRYGDRVKIVCDEGFWLVGTAKLTCLKDGTLSGKMPKCIEI